MLFLSYTAFILMWFDISIFIFLKFILGVSQYSSISDFNNATTKGVFTAWGTPANAPINDTRLWVVRVERYVQNESYGISQMAYCADDNKMFYRISNISTTWGDWKEISTDIPTFYKDYNNLSALASALGAKRLNVRFDGDDNYVCDLYISPSGTAYLQDTYAKNIAEFPVTVLI